MRLLTRTLRNKPLSSSFPLSNVKTDQRHPFLHLSQQPSSSMVQCREHDSISSRNLTPLLSINQQKWRSHHIDLNPLQHQKQIQQQRNYAVADESVMQEVDKEFQNLVTFRDETAQDILNSKNAKNVMHYVKDHQTVYDSIKRMKDTNVGAILVITDPEHENIEENPKSYCPRKDPFDKTLLSGVLSERDYLTKVILMGKRSNTTQVKDIMSEPVITAKADTTGGQCMHIMTHKKVRHLPIVDKQNQNVIGILSIGDLIKYILHEQQETIHFMQRYIERTY